MDSSLEKVDEFLHISRRMRRIALQSAVGGMALSVIGMALASGGLLSPVAGALSQEIIDVLAVFNALRAALRPRDLSDFGPMTRADTPAAPAQSRQPGAMASRP
jgi:cation transport ATPase